MIMAYSSICVIQFFSVGFLVFSVQVLYIYCQIYSKSSPEFDAIVCDATFYSIIFKHLKRVCQDTIGFTFCFCILWSWWTHLFLKLFLIPWGVLFYFIYFLYTQKIQIKSFYLSFQLHWYLLPRLIILFKISSSWLNRNSEDEPSSLIHNFKHTLVFYQ